MLFNLKPYDIFISYVVEDREVVEALCKGLSAKGLRVWYAKRELYIGAPIREVINKGLGSARYGVAIISPDYTSHWAHGEVFALKKDIKRLLPVLHNITIENVSQRDPELGTIYCETTEKGTESVIECINQRVERKSYLYYKFVDTVTFLTRKRRTVCYLFLASLTAALLITIAWYYHAIRPDTEVVTAAIEQRKNSIKAMVEKEFEENITTNHYAASSLSEVMRYTPGSNRRYSFFNGIDYIKSIAGLKNANIIPAVEPVSPPFGMVAYKTHLFKNENTNPNGLKYTLVNLVPHQCEIVDTRLDNDLYEVDVHFTNALRYVEVIVFNDSIGKSSCVANFIGTKPNETLVFEKTGDRWVFLQVR